MSSVRFVLSLTVCLAALGLAVIPEAFAEVVAFPPGDTANCSGGRGVLTWNGNLATNAANNVLCRRIPNTNLDQVLVSDGDKFVTARTVDRIVPGSLDGEKLARESVDGSKLVKKSVTVDRLNIGECGANMVMTGIVNGQLKCVSLSGESTPAPTPAPAPAPAPKPAPAPVDASCDVTPGWSTPGTCATGTFAYYIRNGEAKIWLCKGLNGGKNEYCGNNFCASSGDGTQENPSTCNSPVRPFDRVYCMSNAVVYHNSTDNPYQGGFVPIMAYCRKYPNPY